MAWWRAVIVLAVAVAVSTDRPLVQMIRDVIQQRQWNHVVLLDPEDSAAEILSPQEMAQLLRDVVNSAAGSIIPLASNNTVVLGLHRSIQTSTFQDEADSDADIERVMYLRNPRYRLQFIAQWDEAGQTSNFMRMAGKLGFYTEQQEWLVLLSRNVSFQQVKDVLADVNLYVDSEVMLCLETVESRFEIIEVWNVGREAGSHTLQQETWGFWSPATGLRQVTRGHKYDRRKDLQGFHLRVATIETMPYESLVEDKTLQNFHEGYVVDVWHTLQEQLNFTYTATNTLFGSLQKDGHTWNGMVGMLQTDDADVAVAPLSITQIRSLSIDFTIPIQIVSTRLYIRRPVLEGTWTLYGQPFDVYLWVTIPVSILTCAAALWLFNSVTVYLGVNQHFISASQAFWIIFSGIIQQSTTVEPRPVSGKIVFFSGLWMGLVLLTCYSAILVSILTTRQPQLPFKDFEGLLKNPNWNLGVRTNTALADSLALAPVGSPMRMSWEKMVGKDPIKNLPDNNDDALASVLQGKYAFFANKEYIIYRLQRQLPVQQAMDIVDTKTDFLRRGIGFGLQKRSPYKNLFNHVLSKMTQKGHLNRLKRKWWPNIDRNPEKDYPAPGFKEVFTVFIILGGGIICALAFLLIEGLVHDYSSSSSSKQSTSPSLY
ncbi:glutamate receptor ionotropic, kainate glr-3-like isoform X2 [Scylla paramamosain]